jgi:hypothetical protein
VLEVRLVNQHAEDINGYLYHIIDIAILDHVIKSVTLCTWSTNKHKCLKYDWAKQLSRLNVSI